MVYMYTKLESIDVLPSVFDAGLPSSPVIAG